MTGTLTRSYFYDHYTGFLARDFLRFSALQKIRNFPIIFGTAPSSRCSGKAEAVKCLPWLWADCDKTKPHDFKPEPDIIVFSGRNYHAYWRLREPIPADKRAKRLLLKVRAAVASDRVHDFSRNENRGHEKIMREEIKNAFANYVNNLPIPKEPLGIPDSIIGITGRIGRNLHPQTVYFEIAKN